MNKQITKILTVLILALIFPLASNFCFQGLLDSIWTAEAALVVNADQATSDLDTCHEEAATGPIEKQIPRAPLSHPNSLLPCCLDGSHPSATLSSGQSAEIEKSAPALFFTNEQVAEATPDKILYRPLIMAPPELLTVKTTILRL